jgi:hypothetical protein
MKTILVVFGFVLLSVSALAQDAQEPTPPSYCKPCLFYGGDFDPNNQNADSLGNADTLHGQLTTYVPFFVPEEQVWTVKGLFSNNLSDLSFVDPEQMEWSISTGVSAGNPGTVIASGTIHATFMPTGRSFQAFTEYTLLGRLTPETAVTLTSGVYWMTAVPLCTRQTGYCEGAVYQLSDVEDVPAPNHKGIQPNDDSYYSFPNGQLYFVQAWGSSGACGGVGCDKFSAGLLGTATPDN